MKSGKEQLLKETYKIFKQLCFYDLPMEKSKQYLTEDIMGYGTHIDEKIIGIQGFKDLLQLQRDQSLGLEISTDEIPVFEKKMAHGDAAIFVEELIISIKTDGDQIKLNVRLTTVLEYIERKWYVMHWHGSLGTGNEGDKDTWSVNELKERNRELEKKVAERTEDLRVSLEELKAAQSQLIQSEKMASLGELTAGIAHEIQNPLNFVNNFSEVNTELLIELKEEIEKKNYEEVSEIADDVITNQQKINNHGKRADTIVKGMLQHSRTSNGQKELTNINALTDEFLRLAYHGLRAKDKSFNAKLETQFDASLGKVNIAAQDIGRVILNLINNAFYAVNDRKKQEQGAYEPTVMASTKKIGDQLEVKITDNGLGIPSDIKEKIFQPFFTTKPTGQGTGLGLSLSYDIVKAHGGELKVETREGEGTSFIINLPNKV